MSYNENPAYLPLTGGTMTGTLTLNGAPSGTNDAANKGYVDTISAGFEFKSACVCASTATLTVTYANGAAGVGATLTNAGAQAAFSVDGISPTVGQRVLISQQSTTSQNGIYTVTVVGTGATNWVLTRSTDYNTPSQIQAGDLIPIETGTLYANTLWLQTATVAAIGVGNAITFTQFSSAPITTTQYDVLVGGSSNTIGGVGPGSAGQALLSGGASANPAYSTPTYPSASGSAGQILRSDATNNVYSTATYPNTVTAGDIIVATASQTIGSLAVSPIPGATAMSTGASVAYLDGSNYMYEFDDFLNMNTAGKLGWNLGQSGTSAGTSINTTNAGPAAGHPGVVQLGTGSTGTGTASFSGATSNTAGGYFIGGGAASFTFTVMLPTLSAAADIYTVWIGMCKSAFGAQPADGIYFSYTNGTNSGNWVGNCSAASSTTSANGAVPPVAGTYQRLRIDTNAAGTSIAFYINDVQIANSPLAANITTLGLVPWLCILKQNGSTGTTPMSLRMDRFSMYQNFTTPR